MIGNSGCWLYTKHSANISMKLVLLCHLHREDTLGLKDMECLAQSFVAYEQKAWGPQSLLNLRQLWQS